MKILITILILLQFIQANNVHDDVNKLLEVVKSTSISQVKIDNNRLEEFLRDKKQKIIILNNAKEKLEKEKQRSIILKEQIDKNEKELAKLEEKLKLRVGNLGEMFGVVRQIGGDLRVTIADSATTASIKGRDEILANMLETKELPNIDKLEQLWYLLYEEIIASGKVESKPMMIINSDGTKTKTDVTTIGIFTAISQGEFLNYMPEFQKYQLLPSQPSSRYTSIAEDFENSHEVSRMVIDPTQGMILSMFAQKPTISQRVEQGGVIGYIILTLGFVGIIIALYRLYILNNISKSVDNQLQNMNSAKDDNPLGRVMMVFDKYSSLTLSTFEAKLEEAILKELPSLKSLETIIKLIATVSPLLGLLGTVTGMIETFGAITLFGTGDPKLMAGGISQALMTTVLGLVVAIPMLFIYTFVSSKSSKIVALLDEQSAGLIVKKIEKDI